MSLENFLKYLQQLLTMLNPKDEYSIALAKSALSQTAALARISQKADVITLRVMMAAEERFEYFADHKEDYAGVPGEYNKNEIKRRRLRMVLLPSC